MRKATRSLIAAALIALGSMGCGGSGCSTLDPIPGGFPSAERTPNAMQMRVSVSGFAKIQSDPTAFAKQLIGPTLALDVPASCGGAPEVCCPGGAPASPCGPIQFDVTAKPGDDPRLLLGPVAGASRINVTLRTRVKTVTDIPINVLGVNCGLKIDTTPGPTQDLQFDVPINFAQDPVTGTTRMEPGDISISRLTSDDVQITGAVACSFASLGLNVFLDTLESTLADGIKDQVQAALCKECPSGSVAECGSFATDCAAGVCMVGTRCIQELGPSGRMPAATLFEGAPPGSAGALDLYEVAGGYATTNNNGAALGVLAGLLPAGTPHDRCGPPAVAPAPATIALSNFFQGNTRPDTGQPFDVGIGLHASQAERFAYAAYDGGVLCPTFDTRSLTSLTSSAFGTQSPSLDNLTRGNSPLWVGFRPQSPPAVSLGANSFTAGGVVDDPLLTLAFTQVELDVFAHVERQPIRVATVVADMQMPLGMTSPTPGEVTLVSGPLQPMANVSVKNSEPLLETTDALKALAEPLQLELVPEMIRRVGPIALPPVAGLAVAPSDITTVDNTAFIALYGNLVPPGSANPTATPPFIDDPVSPPFLTRVPTPDFAPIGIFAFGLLLVVLAARRRALPAWTVWSVAVASASLVAPIACGDSGDDASTKKKKGDAGADANDGSTASDGGIDSGTDGAVESGTCVPSPCQAGELVPALGEWNAVATGARTVIATYDAKFGDAVLVELAGTTQSRKVIDGVPNDPPTHDPSGYRGGVEAPGANVGAWTSVALAGDRARVAYQDRDRGALKLAIEDTSGNFTAHDIDVPPAGVEAGAHASLALGATPAVAYVATGLPGANGVFDTELRFARAKSATPTQPSDWTTSVVATAPGSCAGLCGTDVCVALSSAGESEQCVTPTTDCTSACSASQVCVAATCRTVVPAALAALPRGTGLFARLLVLTDGRFAIVHYDSVQSALIAQIETGSGTSQFTATVLDGGDTRDRGMWAAAVLDGTGTIQVAYTDALSHQVYALGYKPGDAPSAPELVDDGLRSGDRPHWVGAGLTAWLDGSSFRVAYQDAMSADVVVATRSSGTWSHADLVSGTELDGFALAAPASGTGPLVWDQLDPNDATSHALTIQEKP